MTQNSRKEFNALLLSWPEELTDCLVCQRTTSKNLFQCEEYDSTLQINPHPENFAIAKLIAVKSM